MKNPKKVWNFFKHHIRLFVPLILFILIIILTVLKFNENYKYNLVTELIGALITVVVVDSLYRIKESNEDKEREIKKIKNMYNLISIYILEYIKYINCLVDPLGNNHRPVTSIEINDLQHIYDSTLYRIGPIFTPTYELYFSSLKRLTEAFKTHVALLDIDHSKVFIEILQDFIINNDSDLLYLAFKERANAKYGNKPAYIEDKETLKNYQGSKEYTKNANLMDIYITLYKQIKENLISINKFNDYYMNATK